MLSNTWKNDFLKNAQINAEKAFDKEHNLFNNQINNGDRNSLAVARREHQFDEKIKFMVTHFPNTQISLHFSKSIVSHQIKSGISLLHQVQEDARGDNIYNIFDRLSNLTNPNLDFVTQVINTCSNLNEAIPAHTHFKTNSFLNKNWFLLYFLESKTPTPLETDEFDEIEPVFNDLSNTNLGGMKFYGGNPLSKYLSLLNNVEPYEYEKYWSKALELKVINPKVLETTQLYCFTKPHFDLHATALQSILLDVNLNQNTLTFLNHKINGALDKLHNSDVAIRPRYKEMIFSPKPLPFIFLASKLKDPSTFNHLYQFADKSELKTLKDYKNRSLVHFSSNFEVCSTLEKDGFDFLAVDYNKNQAINKILTISILNKKWDTVQWAFSYINKIGLDPKDMMYNKIPIYYLLDKVPEELRPKEWQITPQMVCFVVKPKAFFEMKLTKKDLSKKDEWGYTPAHTMMNSLTKKDNVKTYVSQQKKSLLFNKNKMFLNMMKHHLDVNILDNNKNSLFTDFLSYYLQNSSFIDKKITKYFFKNYDWNTLPGWKNNIDYKAIKIIQQFANGSFEKSKTVEFNLTPSHWEKILNKALNKKHCSIHLLIEVAQKAEISQRNLDRCNYLFNSMTDKEINERDSKKYSNVTHFYFKHDLVKLLSILETKKLFSVSGNNKTKISKVL